MEQAGIVKTGHDGHQGVESRTVFRGTTATRRAKGRQANVDRMREGRLRLTASTGGAESQAGLLAVAWRVGVGKPVRQPCESGRGGREPRGISLRRVPGGGGDQQAEGPDRALVGVAATGRHQHAPLHVASDPSDLVAQPQRWFLECRGPRDVGETVLQA